MDYLEVATSSNNVVRKRGPGRPKLTPQTPELKVCGVVEKPDSPEHKMEFLYKDPMVFRKLFTYLKNNKAHNIHIIFRKDHIAFMSRDHSNCNRIVAYCSGETANWYYCAEEFRVGVNLDNYEMLFCNIDKSSYKIKLVCRHDDPDNINIILTDLEVGKEHSSKMRLSIFEQDEELFEVEDCLDIKDFPLEFVLSSKSFKRDIANIGEYSETMCIEKVGTFPLQFTYSKVNVGVFAYTFDDPAKIKLRSDIEDDRVFKCRLKISNAHAIAKSLVTDNISILCKENGCILFKSDLDNGALIVHTYVQFDA